MITSWINNSKNTCRKESNFYFYNNNQFSNQIKQQNRCSSKYNNETRIGNKQLHLDVYDSIHVVIYFNQKSKIYFSKIK